MRGYQTESYTFCRKTRNPYLNMDCGLGKTLVAIRLIQHYNRPTLVVAPKNVALYTWPEELGLWAPGLPYTVIRGTPKQRNIAVGRTAPIHVISFANLAWLIKNHKWKWDLVILDEISFMKSTDSTRFRAFKKIRKHVGKVIGMSATPAANNIGALWSQYYCLDGGKTLGKTVTGFRDKFMKDVGRDYSNWVPREGARAAIIKLIRPTMLSIRAEDHLNQLPEAQHINHYFQMKTTKEYQEMEKDSVISDLDILAGSAGAKSMKLRQLASGFIYAAEDTHIIGEDKIQAFDL